jgi:hypothetical protein
MFELISGWVGFEPFSVQEKKSRVIKKTKLINFSLIHNKKILLYHFIALNLSLEINQAGLKNSNLEIP